MAEAAAELACVIPADHYGWKCFAIIAFGVFSHEVFPLAFGDGGVGDEEPVWDDGVNLGFVIRSA